MQNFNDFCLNEAVTSKDLDPDNPTHEMYMYACKLLGASGNSLSLAQGIATRTINGRSPLREKTAAKFLLKLTAIPK